MNESNFKQNRYRCYKQYIQFLNEQEFKDGQVQALFIFQQAVLTVLLLSLVATSEPLRSVSLLGVHNLLLFVAGVSSGLQNAMIAGVFILLLIPLAVPVQILAKSYTAQYIRNGEYKRQCQFSVFHRAVRAYLATFEYLFLPIHLFFLISLANSLLTTIACLLSFATVALVDYHFLDITYKQKNRLTKLSFPNKLIDTAIYQTIILLAGMQSNSFGFFVVCLGNFLRLLLSFFLPSYSSALQEKHQIYLAINQIFALGLLVAYYMQRVEIIVLVTAILGAVAFAKQQAILALFHREQRSELQELADEESIRFKEELSLEELMQVQSRFQKLGYFAGIFRRLIFMGRGNVSNREYLTLQILKSKCYGIEINSRGNVAKLMDCETVMKYEGLLREIVCLVLQISDRSISIMKLMKLKEEFPYIFNSQVQVLIQLVAKMKRLIRELMKINEWSLEGNAILAIMFKEIMRQEPFLEEIKLQRRRNRNENDRDFKVHLFNEQTVMVFVNMLDEVGRIVKTSKNLPALLGYSPHELKGIELDTLLLASMKDHHIKNMSNFINAYDKRQALNPRSVDFYINNSRYELQKINVGYNLVMSSFNMFQMCGIISRVEHEGDILILNSHGNLEGCTRQIGLEFGLIEVAGTSMNKFNVLCLLPALLKYGNKDVSLKTIMFNVKNIRSNVLGSSPKSPEQLSAQVYRLFLKLLEEDIIDGYFVDIEVKHYTFFAEQIGFKEIFVRSYEKIMNFAQIKERIENSLKLEKPPLESEVKSLCDTDFDLVLHEEVKDNLDTNFTLDPSKPSIIRQKELNVTGIDYQDKMPLEVSRIYGEAEGKTPQCNLGAETQIDNSSNDLRIQRNWKYVNVLFIVVLLFVGLVIFDFVSLGRKNSEMRDYTNQIIRNNKALLIVLKSVYDLDRVDIEQFDRNQLLVPFSGLAGSSFNFTTHFRSSILYNDFYMFNVHLPALLKKILSSSPALAAESREELLLNIGKIIREAESIFKEVISSWLGGVDSVLSQSYLKLGLYIVANLFFLLVGLCILTSRRKQLRAYDAFFKFEKEEVEKKVGRIKWYVKSIEGQVRRWNLFKEFNAYVKEADIFNLEFENIRVTYEPKIGFEVSEEKEQQIKNGESCRYAANLMVVVLTQVIFYVVYVSLNNQFIETLRNTPQEVNGCSKSMVVPSLLLVSIEQQVPKTILDSYLNQTSVCLAKTIASLPNFLSFVATAPCPNCSFLYPLLTTNYVSFFHSFLGMVTLSRNSSVPPYDFSDMTEAGAVVSQNIGEQLLRWSNSPPSFFVPLSYVLSIAAVIVVAAVNIRRINKEIERMEEFLQFFSREMVEKNKLMLNLLTKVE